jgi:hypothetical protein
MSAWHEVRFVNDDEPPHTALPHRMDRWEKVKGKPVVVGNALPRSMWDAEMMGNALRDGCDCEYMFQLQPVYVSENELRNETCDEPWVCRRMLEMD